MTARTDRELVGVFGVTVLAIVRKGLALEQKLSARRERKAREHRGPGNVRPSDGGEFGGAGPIPRQETANPEAGGLHNTRVHVPADNAELMLHKAALERMFNRGGRRNG